MSGKKDSKTNPLFTLGAILGSVAAGETKIPDYIGGTKEETRNKYWQQNPIIVNAVDSIAKRYNLDTNVLLERLTQEGFVDAEINNINDAYFNKDYVNIKQRQYDVLNGNSYNGFEHFGLDFVPSMIEDGTVKPINEKYRVGATLNEQNQIVNPAFGLTTLDNIGLMAATLKGLRDTAKTHYKTASANQLDEYSNIYYNRGIGNGKKAVRNKVKGYKIPNRMRSLKLGGKNK